MPNIRNIVLDYMEAKRLTYRSLAELMNEILKERPYPPKSISHAAIAYWVSGETTPDPPRLEYIADNADDDDLRQFAADILSALADEFDIAGVS